MTVVLLAILVALMVPPALTRRASHVPILPVVLRLVIHVVPVASLPFGLFLLARDGHFVPALLGLAGYLGGAVRAARVRTPALTAEASLLHPILALREALATTGRPAAAVETAAAAEPVVVERTRAAN